MGYIEETGAAQHYRDARIAAIYEGTNGIQAIDLVTRKLPLSGGATVKAYIAELRHTVEAINVQQRPRLRLDQRAARGRARQPRAHHAVAAQPAAERSGHAARRAPRPISGCSRSRPAAPCWPNRRWPRNANGGGADAAARIALARFFAENIAVAASGLERIVFEGADSVNHAEAALA